MIQLLSKRLAVEPIYDSDYYTDSKLIKIPDAAKERCDQGIVKYIGPGCDPEIKIGQHVTFSGYTGTTFRLDNEILILVHSDFIKSIIDIPTYSINNVYFKGKVNSNALELAIRKILYDDTSKIDKVEALIKLFAHHYNDVLIPATYETVFHEVAIAYKKYIGTRIDIKKEEYIEQRDEYDERNR